MRDLNLIIELQEKLQLLTGMYKELEKLIEQLSSIIDNKEFIPEQLKESIHDMLSSISNSQSEFARSYSEIEIGDLTTSISIIDENLEKCRVSLSEKEKYRKIIDYINNLQSTDSDVSIALQNEQSFLSAFDIEEESSESCKETLGKYFVLKEAIEETDSKKRFDFAFSSLIGIFDKDIIFGVTNGLVYYKPMENSIQAPKNESNMSISTDTVLNKEDTESEQTTDDQEYLTENEIPCDEGNAEEPENSDSRTELMEDFTEDDWWSELEVQDPSGIIYDIDDSLMKVNTSHKIKKFSASSFKNEVYSGISGVNKIFVMKEAFEYYGVVPASVAGFLDKDKDDIKTAADRLVRAGYLSEYVLLKNEFDKYHSYYALTPNGVKAFRSKEASAVLQIKYDSSASLLYEGPTSAGELLSRLQAEYTLELISKTNVVNYSIAPPLFSDNAFFRRFSIINESEEEFKFLMFTGIYSSDPADFELYKEYLQKIEDTSYEIVVVGMSFVHARSVATWIRGFSNISTIIFYDMPSNKYYMVDTDEEIDFSEYVKTQNTQEEEKNNDDGNDEAKIEDSASQAVSNPDNLVVEAEPAIKTTENIVEETQTIEVETLIDSHSAEEEQKNKTSTSSEIVPSEESKSPTASYPDQRQSYDNTFLKMLIEEKYYCATAYSYALAKEFSEYKNVYLQLAYALNDPLGNCSYSSDNVYSVYFGEGETYSDYFAVSASLRNFFLDQLHYDYLLQNLYNVLSGEDLLQNHSALQKVAYTLMQFKAEHHRGIDFYADYRQKKGEKYEDALRMIRKEAKDFYEKYCVKQNEGFHARMAETRKILFGDGSDIKAYIEAIMNNDRSYLELIIDHLSSKYIKSDMELSPDNIDHHMVDIAINESWVLAGKRVPNKKGARENLVGVYRTKTANQIVKAVTILCNYVSVVSRTEIDENDKGLGVYKRIRESLMEDISDAIMSLKQEEPDSLKNEAGRRVLLHTLHDLSARLDGSYDDDTKKFFYVDFLRNDKVLLDKKFCPVFINVSEINELSILTRIEDHVKSPLLSFENRLDSIIRGQDDYGSAALILQYLKLHPLLINDQSILLRDVDKLVGPARKGMPAKRNSFIGDLELAQSYGQIDNTTENRKETLIEIMDFWYDWAMDTNNYGFFYKILEAMRNKIKDDAHIREVELERNLSAYFSAHPDWEEDEKSATAIEQIRKRIEKQNYAAAEDLLNRLIAGDFDSESVFIQHDYLMEFLDEYPTNFNMSGKSNASLRSSQIARGHNKDSRGAGKIIENWPNGSLGLSANKIRDLMTTLGFQINSVERDKSNKDKGTEKGNQQQFQVRIRRPENGRKSNYKHPISVFGSEAEDKGFRIVVIFGKMDAVRLIDTFKEIGSAQNTIVLLDYALTLPERRELARRTKTEYSKKTFVVIDRVVAVYLARHYSETAVNRMLMAVTMPFASYQPYIADSAKIMPQEIFMGRTTELDKIESASGVNIVYGGRQLGKSALLRMAQKDINKNENNDRAVLVDIKGRDYKAAAKRVSETLIDEGILTTSVTEDWGELSRNIKNRLRITSDDEKIPYFLLLLDEADVFIESCEKVGYAPFDALKDIQNIGPGRFKFVVAGLRNIVRFNKTIALSNNSVLTHLSSLTVTPFKSTEARELLEVPLSYLGFRFRNDSSTEMLISTIFGTTNYFPGLLQLYCSKLIEAVQRDYAGYNEENTPPYVVSESHIKKVLADKTLQEQIKEKFDITLRVGDDDYYYLIALLAAFNYHNNKEQNGCDANDILEIASSYDISKISSLSNEKVTALMEEMLELNVLQRIGNGKFRFARHNFCEMMGSASHIDDEIMEYAMKQES